MNNSGWQLKKKQRERNPTNASAAKDSVYRDGRRGDRIGLGAGNWLQRLAEGDEKQSSHLSELLSKLNIG